MSSRKRVVVGMSGGVDSAVTAALLVEQGYDVVGVTLNLAPKMEEGTVERDDACCTLSAVEDARRVADQLGIPHYCLNLRDVFAETVIANFVEEYRRGRTPNPCVRCNDFIKFETVLKKGLAMGADLVATGHYARIDRDPESGRYRLLRGIDRRKDQSYVLYVLTQEELSRTVFPVGAMTKEETREEARRRGLRIADKRESQDICFIDGDYRDFLARVAPDMASAGPVVDLDGRIVGEHRGIAFHTVGQRRGLGIAGGTPLYVVAIDAKSNSLVVGPESALFDAVVTADDVNLIPVDRIDHPTRVEAKLRYRMPAAAGWASQTADGRLQVAFDEPQRAPTPGQAIVCYEDESVLGGGTILVNSAIVSSKTASRAGYSSS